MIQTVVTKGKISGPKYAGRVGKYLTDRNSRIRKLQSKMSKKFDVSEKRYVVVKKNEIRLFEDGSRKMATFSYPRWAQFVEYFEEVDNAVSKLVKDEGEVKLRIHIGGGWHVSVTSGYHCVDLRKFFLAQDGATKPTRTGIALRLSEWDRLKQIAREMKEQHPKIADAQPCWSQSDHFNQEGALMCNKCNPFGNWFAGT